MQKQHCLDLDEYERVYVCATLHTHSRGHVDDYVMKDEGDRLALGQGHDPPTTTTKPGDQRLRKDEQK